MINPLRVDIPLEITTTRLRLRCPRIGDGAAIFESVRASLPELKVWMPWATDDYDAPSAEDWCRRAVADHATGKTASYLIFHAQRNHHIGTITAFSKGWEIPKFEIGYWLATRECGEGYMNEALTAVTQMTFETMKARRIVIRTDVENHRSRRVAERAGYKLEGILKFETRNVKSELSDDCVYAMTK